MKKKSNYPSIWTRKSHKQWRYAHRVRDGRDMQYRSCVERNWEGVHAVQVRCAWNKARDADHEEFLKMSGAPPKRA